MRWKWILTLLFLGALAAAGIVGWVKWNALQKQKETANALIIAKGWLQDGNDERAQAALEKLLAENPRQPEADSIWARLGQSYQKTNNPAKAIACWNKVRDQYPASPHYPGALNAIAEAAFARGDVQEAGKLWEQIVARHPASDCVGDALYGQARVLLKAGSTEPARKALAALVETQQNSPRIREIEDQLGRMNLEKLYSADAAEGGQIYKIEKGDRLAILARRFGVSADLIAKVNRIRDERALVIGRRLRIPKTDFSIRVDKAQNTLLLLNDGKFFKRYTVRTGKNDWQTPVGTFHIQRKVKNPSWNDPETGKSYPPNDPENALGSRWLAFEGSIGIHGTNKPETIGQYASNGCVGMLPADVEELFDLVPEGATVEITGKTRKIDPPKTNPSN